eukprot:7541877-Prorocentrum_lima.AAC.1
MGVAVLGVWVGRVQAAGEQAEKVVSCVESACKSQVAPLLPRGGAPASGHSALSKPIVGVVAPLMVPAGTVELCTFMPAVPGLEGDLRCACISGHSGLVW